MITVTQSEVDRVRLENAIKNLGPQARTKLPGQPGERIIVLVVDEVVRLRAELKRKEEHLELCEVAMRIAQLALNRQLEKSVWDKIKELLP